MPSRMPRGKTKPKAMRGKGERERERETELHLRGRRGRSRLECPARRRLRTQPRSPRCSHTSSVDVKSASLLSNRGTVAVRAASGSPRPLASVLAQPESSARVVTSTWRPPAFVSEAEDAPVRGPAARNLPTEPAWRVTSRTPRFRGRPVCLAWLGSQHAAARPTTHGQR